MSFWHEFLAMHVMESNEQYTKEGEEGEEGEGQPVKMQRVHGHRHWPNCP